jgi:predicted RNase H-like HicB family nuclease
MTRKYSLLIEGDESGYSAYIPELPTILVTGKSLDELTRRATDAIQLWWENAKPAVSSTAFRREIEVELPLA